MEACWVRGSVTTPARRVTLERNCEAVAMRSLELSRLVSNWRRISAVGGLIERLHVQQRVDEEAIALVGGDASGGSVRGGDEAELLQIGHDVADGRGAQLQSGLAREHPGTDGLPVADVAFDQNPQQVLSTLAQRLVPTFVRHRHHEYCPASHNAHSWAKKPVGRATGRFEAPARHRASEYRAPAAPVRDGPAAVAVLQRRRLARPRGSQSRLLMAFPVRACALVGRFADPRVAESVNALLASSAKSARSRSW